MTEYYAYFSWNPPAHSERGSFKVIGPWTQCLYLDGKYLRGGKRQDHGRHYDEHIAEQKLNSDSRLMWYIDPDHTDDDGQSWRFVQIMSKEDLDIFNAKFEGAGNDSL